MAGGDFLPWSHETPELELLLKNQSAWAMDFDKWLMFVQLLGIFAGVMLLLPPWQKLFRTSPEDFSTPAVQSGEGAVDIEANAAAPTDKKPQRKRLFYLDALKACLMLLVIMQHTGENFGDENGAGVFNLYACKDVYANLWNMTKEEANTNCSTMGGLYFFPRFQIWFRALNETYFMELFFFVSGFFTPSSFDRKGLTPFLADKFKRLGIPAVAWYFFLGPLFVFFTARVFGFSFSYGQDGTWLTGGAPWFIAWLLTFNVAYAFVDGAPVKMSLPNVGTLLLTGSILGVLIKVSDYHGDVFNTPNGIKEIIPCALAFSSGVVAKRSAWLEQLEAMPGHTMWFLRVLVMLYAGCWALALGMMQVSVIAGINFNGSLDQLTIFQGMMLLVIPIVLIDFFRRFLNGGSSLMTILSEATFLVYIIHPYILMPVVWSYVALIRACGAVVVRTQISTAGFTGAYPVAFAVQSGSDGLLWLGWFYTLLVANALVWPLAHFLRKLPGLRQVF